MLKKIICDIFLQKEIVFHEGLNAIVGDDVASNSIGKSWIEIFFLKKTRSGRYKRKTVLSAGECSVLRELDCSKRTFYTKRKDRSKKKIWIKIECMFESGEGKGRFDRFVCIKSLEFVHLQE